MTTTKVIKSNFAVLQVHDEQFLRLGLLAERYFPDDPNTCLDHNSDQRARLIA
jgi:type I restriction enzyme R subunit